jgi:hypothetical protein
MGLSEDMISEQVQKENVRRCKIKRVKKHIVIVMQHSFALSYQFTQLLHFMRRKLNRKK